ncbi:MAG TPA: glycine cleavage system protein GcvH [Streptosporangiaceae bacterium]
MSVPEQLQYTAEHEWVTINGQTATVGITEHAANALGDVVYVSPPAVGASVTAGEPCGEIESTKSVSDLFSPVNGEVSDVNADIEDDPGQVNTDPYGTGWLFKIAMTGEPPSDLLSAAEYTQLISEPG